MMGLPVLAGVSTLTTDLLVAIALAGAAALITARLRMPPLLGYVIAGVLAAGSRSVPFLPWEPLVNMEGVLALAELGVAVLMFDLGLELSLSRLRSLGWTVFVGGFIQSLIMTGLGMAAGQAVGLEGFGVVAAGLVVSVSSTAISLRGLEARGETGDPHGHTIAAVLIVEDVLAALLITFVAGAALDVGAIAGLLGTTLLFSFAAVALGVLLIPRLVDAVARTGSRDALVLTSLGLAFGLGLAAIAIGASAALGAFLAGIIMAESRSHLTIRTRIEALKDVFMGLFFVSVGLLVQPQVHPLLPLLFLVVLVGKPLAVLTGLVLAGRDPRQSLRTGLGMASVGEFNFVLATASVVAGAPVALISVVALLSATTAVLNPVVVKAEHRLARLGRIVVPEPAQRIISSYSTWAERALVSGKRDPHAELAGRTLLLAAAVLGAASLLGRSVEGSWMGVNLGLLIAAAGLLLALPLALVAGRQLLQVGRSGNTPGASALLPLLLLALAFLHLAPLLTGPAPAVVGMIAFLAVGAFVLWRAADRDRSRVRTAVDRVLADLPPEQRRRLGQDLMERYPWTCYIESIPIEHVTPDLGDLRLESRTGARAIAHRRDGQLTADPSGEMSLAIGDELIVAGRPEQVAEAHLAILAAERAEPKGLGQRFRSGQAMSEVRVPPGSPVVGRTLADIDVRARTGVLIIAVGRDGELLPAPGPSTVVRAEDVLVAVGTDGEMAGLRALLVRG